MDADSTSVLANIVSSTWIDRNTAVADSFVGVVAGYFVAFVGCCAAVAVADSYAADYFVVAGYFAVVAAGYFAVVGFAGHFVAVAVGAIVGTVGDSVFAY